MIDKKLREYIEKNILPLYDNNFIGDGRDRFFYVINRSREIVEKNDLNIDWNILYTAISYQDIKINNKEDGHELVSAEIMYKDEFLKTFFNDKERLLIKEAIEDQRAKLASEPRSVYGKILSSASRNSSVEQCLKRSYYYGKKKNPNATDEEIFEGAYEALRSKYGKNGKANFFFKDATYERFLRDIRKILTSKDIFIKKQREYMKTEKQNEKLKSAFNNIKSHNPNMSLDEVLHAVYDEVKNEYNKSFSTLRNDILNANGINELKYYTKNVRQDLKDYITEHIFPEYEKNDGGHNIAHILEVIRRSFALNDTFKLGLDDNIIYAIASCHDWGKYEDHETHHLIAAKNFMNDKGMKKFFTNDERKIIKEAIEDHRSSKEDEPRSIYGKLISSADRNTRIEIVFIRSFFVAHERMPEAVIEDYLDYTIKRLSQKYDEENPENMFFEDETYKIFIQDMRDLLKKENEFKDRYCEVNHISSRQHRVRDEQGEVAYTKSFEKM